LEKVKEEKLFADFRNIHKPFGFHFDFECGEKRAIRLLSKAVSAFSSVGQLLTSR
jgi:hypothetical protein